MFKALITRYKVLCKEIINPMDGEYFKGGSLFYIIASLLLYPQIWHIWEGTYQWWFFVIYCGILWLLMRLYDSLISMERGILILGGGLSLCLILFVL